MLPKDETPFKKPLPKKSLSPKHNENSSEPSSEEQKATEEKKGSQFNRSGPLFSSCYSLELLLPEESNPSEEIQNNTAPSTS